MKNKISISLTTQFFIMFMALLFLRAFDVVDFSWWIVAAPLLALAATFCIAIISAIVIVAIEELKGR